MPALNGKNYSKFFPVKQVYFSQWIDNVEVCPGFVVQEAAARHAIVTSFEALYTQNTWISGKRGLSVGIQSSLLANWISMIEEHFKTHYQLQQ